MYYFIETACVLTELWMIHMFSGSLHERRERSTLRLWILSLIFGFLILALSFQENGSYVRLATSFLGIWVLAYVLYDSSVLSSLFTSVIFCTLVVLADIISTLILTSLDKDIEQMMLYGSIRALYLVIEHIVLLASVLAVCFICQRREIKMSFRVILPVLPCWLVTILLCTLLSWQVLAQQQELHPLYLIVVIGLLYINIIFIYHTQALERNEKEKRDAEIAEHHCAMQQEYYDQFRVQQEETRALWHDISKYLRASTVDSSDAALQQVQEMLDSISCVVDVNNRVVSVILNEYYQAALSSGIELNFDVQIPSELFVTAADLYVIIGNTLDNALEACADLPREKRIITLKLKTHHNILYYEIQNPYAPKPDPIIKGKYHGFGVKNVRRCVEKYNGTVNIYQDDGNYRLTAYLNSL